MLDSIVFFLSCVSLATGSGLRGEALHGNGTSDDIDNGVTVYERPPSGYPPATVVMAPAARSLYSATVNVGTTQGVY